MAETPTPVSGITSDALGELLTSVRLPDRLPVETGVKPTANEDEPPGATESGKGNPQKLKPVPVMDARVMMRVTVPGFLIVNVWERLTPMAKVPKLTPEGVTEICG